LIKFKILKLREFLFKLRNLVSNEKTTQPSINPEIISQTTKSNYYSNLQ